MNCKAVIFDMDGVILDSESICDKTWEMAKKELHLPPVKEDVINLCRGTNKNDTIQILKNIYGDSIDAQKFLELTSKFFYQIEDKSGIPLLPYAKEILDYLKPKYKIALASSTKETSVRRQLTNTNVIHYFEKIITGDVVEHSKPDPEIYRLACNSIGEDPSFCVAVEDSPNGIKSAFNAGLKVIMVPDRIQPTDEIKKYCWKICKSLNEIKEIL